VTVRCLGRRRTDQSVRAFVDGQSLILAAIADIRIDCTGLIVMRARILGQVLSLDSASLCGGMALPGLGRTFLGFRLGALCLGCLFVG
jgi:hypothetical protein